MLVLDVLLVLLWDLAAETVVVRLAAEVAADSLLTADALLVDTSDLTAAAIVELLETDLALDFTTDAFESLLDTEAFFDVAAAELLTSVLLSSLAEDVAVLDAALFLEKELLFFTCLADFSSSVFEDLADFLPTLDFFVSLDSLFKLVSSTRPLDSPVSMVLNSSLETFLWAELTVSWRKLELEEAEARWPVSLSNFRMTEEAEMEVSSTPDSMVEDCMLDWTVLELERVAELLYTPFSWIPSLPVSSLVWWSSRVAALSSSLVRPI